MKATVILPSLNPDEKMLNTVKGLLKEGFNDIVVVDDGSSSEHKIWFEKAASLDGVEVLTHEVNKGKGRAMKTAFEHVVKKRKGISGVVTVDGDGQHLPCDIKKCVEKMEKEHDKVVLGVRDFKRPEVPARSRFGNNLTRAVFRFACGIKISDTQTGLRAIPFKFLPIMIQLEGERYEYETNQLLVIKKQGIEMCEVVINTVYIDDNSSSHFNPIKDSIKIYEIIFKFAASSLCSFVVDIVLFTIINLFTANILTDSVRLLVATGGARLVSSFVNYSMNRKVVFKSESEMSSSLPKYYVLCVCQAAVSYGFVYLIASVIFKLNGSLLETLIKGIVDTCLFLASFQIQQKWVFRK